LERRPGQPAQTGPATVPVRTLELLPSPTNETARGDPAGVAGGTGTSPHAVVSRTMMWAGVGVALVAGLIMGFLLALVLRGPAHHPASPTPTPTRTSSQRPSPSPRASPTPSPSASPGSSATSSPSPSPAPATSTARPAAAGPGVRRLATRPSRPSASMPGLHTSSQRNLG
jgi:hypothetical protein